MKNILSFKCGTRFTGKEILDWANYQIENNTSHVVDATRILIHYWNLKPDEMYLIKTNYNGTSCGEVVRQILIIKANK